MSPELEAITNRSIAKLRAQAQIVTICRALIKHWNTPNDGTTSPNALMATEVRLRAELTEAMRGV